MRGFKIISFLIPAIICLSVPVIVVPLGAMEEASPHGTGSLEFSIGIVLGILCLLVAAGFLVCGILLISPRLRIFSLGYMTSAVSLFVGMCIAGSISQNIRMQALSRLADRSKPLVAAIKNYEQKFGNPPDSLEVLVPEFLPKIPSTAIGVSPKYEYQSLTNSSSYGNNKWVLQIYHAAHSMSFDTFIYLPLQDYSVLSHQYEGQIQNIRDWAYWYQG